MLDKEEKRKTALLYQIIMWAPIVILVILAFISAVTMFIHFWRGIIWICATLIWLIATLRFIRNKPAHVGLVTIWGRKLPIIKKEGWHLLAPFFPLFYNVIRVKAEKVNVKIPYSNIRCRARIENQKGQRTPYAGGEISVDISYTYYVDYKNPESGERVITFINSGGHEKVQDITNDLIEEDIRQMARDKSWEEITFAGDKIRNRLVKKLTGEEPGPETEQELRTNGLPDIADLGIRISRFNVGRVKEQGRLAEAAETFAKELQERRGEAEELEFVYEWVKKFKSLSGVTGPIAIDTIQSERGKATRHIENIEYRGLEEPAQLAKAVVGKVLGGAEKKE